MTNGSKMTYLVKDNGDFFSYQEILERARVQTNFLQYDGTIQAIKAYNKKGKMILSKNIRALLYLLTFQYDKKNRGQDCV